MGLVKLDELSELRLAEGIMARVVTTSTLTITYVRLAAGSKLSEHSHHHEQVVNVIEGELELTVEGSPYRLTRGKVMVLPPNVPHSGRAVSECYVVDVFHPVSEDFTEIENSLITNNLEILDEFKNIKTIEISGFQQKDFEEFSQYAPKSLLSLQIFKCQDIKYFSPLERLTNI